MLKKKWVMKVIPNKVYDIIINLFPMIILFTITMVSIRLITAKYAKEKIVIYKELKSLIYVIYVFALFFLITTTDFESFSNNFIPFKEMTRYKITSVLFWRNVIGNIALFVPFGYLITDNITEKAKKCNVFIATLIAFITSLTTEVIQMNIGRSFDIDDIILNILGAIIGWGAFKVLHRIISKIPESWPKNLIKAIFFIVIIVLFVILVLFSYLKVI